MSYGPIEASLEREQGDNIWVSISIREGKNREVRRIMEHLGLTVNRLIRVSFGPFMLGDLEPGQIEEVKTAVLKDQLGPRLTRQLGVRREPLREERRLTPPRGKPTYLRRKPAAARPEPTARRDTENRPLRRRRIFEEGGAEAPKVEFVPERPPRKPHFAKAGRSGDKSGHHARAGEHTGEREPENRRYLKRPPRQERERPAREWENKEGAARQDAGPGNRDRFAKRRDGSPKPDFKRQERSSTLKGERTHGREEGGHSPARRQKGEGEAPRFKKFGPKPHGEQPRNRRFEANAEAREWKASPDAPKRGDRPPRPFKARDESKQDFGGNGGKRPPAKAGGKPFRDGGKRSPQNRPRPHKPGPRPRSGPRKETP
jgi:23S rRNA pseudouridine2605 synthase